MKEIGKNLERIFRSSSAETEDDINSADLSVEYIKSCKNREKLLQILKHLRVKEKGFYRALEKEVEKAISSLEVKENEYNSNSALPSQDEIAFAKKEISGFSEVMCNLGKSSKTLELEKNESDYVLIDVPREGRIRGEESLKPIDSTVSVSDVLKSVEQEKLKGNECAKCKEYKEAIINYTKAIDLIYQVLEKQPSDKASMMLISILSNRALMELKLCNYENTVKDCNEALRLQKQVKSDLSVKILYRRGVARFKLKEFFKAKQDFNAAVELGAVSKTLFNYILKCKQILSKSSKLCEQSEGVSVTVKELDSSHSWKTMLHKAQTKEANGNIKEALRHYGDLYTANDLPTEHSEKILQKINKILNTEAKVTDQKGEYNSRSVSLNAAEVESLISNTKKPKCWQDVRFALKSFSFTHVESTVLHLNAKYILGLDSSTVKLISNKELDEKHILLVIDALQPSSLNKEELIRLANLLLTISTSKKFSFVAEFLDSKTKDKLRAVCSNMTENYKTQIKLKYKLN